MLPSYSLTVLLGNCFIPLKINVPFPYRVIVAFIGVTVWLTVPFDICDKNIRFETLKSSLDKFGDSVFAPSTELKFP